jgi:hypothetical protein
VDDHCYIEQPLPQVQELIKQVLYEKISSVGSRVIIDVLIATGNEALVNAILAKSLTQQQADMLKQVSIDPQVAAALAQVKGRLLEGVEASVASVQENVLPKVQDAVAEAMQGAVEAAKGVVYDIPFVGDAAAILTTLQTGAETLENVGDIREEFNNATAPVQAAMKQIAPLEAALGAASDAASGAVAGVSGAVAGTVGGVTGAVGGVTDAAASTVAGVSDVASGVSKQVAANLDPNAKPGTGGNQSGGSRTRRRIHKLSRRIERTLRRVQKKYGLQDKNHFLRRTLKRK